MLSKTVTVVFQSYQAVVFYLFYTSEVVNVGYERLKVFWCIILGSTSLVKVTITGFICWIHSFLSLSDKVKDVSMERWLFCGS